MSDFQIIETQEQLDKIIKDRIQRAEQKAAEKYADYDTLKTQNTEYAEQISQLQTQLQAQSEKIQAFETSTADLTSKVQQYETASVKTKVALEMGLPYQMASRLNGDDEQAIRADAQAMVNLIGGANQPAPLGSAGSTAGKNTRDQFADFASAVFND